MTPNHHIHELSEILKRIYGLGDQQAYRLREVIKATYEHAGIPSRPFAPEANQKYPPFDRLRDYFDPDKDSKILGRLSPIFDLNFFSAESGEGQFGSVTEAGTVVRLAQLPGDEVKNSVAEFF